MAKGSCCSAAVIPSERHGEAEVSGCCVSCGISISGLIHANTIAFGDKQGPNGLCLTIHGGLSRRLSGETGSKGRRRARRNIRCAAIAQQPGRFLALALRVQGRKRVRSADETMSAIVAKRRVEHLERSGFVGINDPPIGHNGNDFRPIAARHYDALSN